MKKIPVFRILNVLLALQNGRIDGVLEQAARGGARSLAIRAGAPRMSLYAVVELDDHGAAVRLRKLVDDLERVFEPLVVGGEDVEMSGDAERPRELVAHRLVVVRDERARRVRPAEVRDVDAREVLMLDLNAISFQRERRIRPWDV